MTLIVIWMAKLSGWLSQVFGRGEATSLPGLVAERLDPKILERLGRNLKQVVLVTGTNGKTTTTRMIAEVVKTDQPDLIVNRAGSNLTRGLISTLIANSNWTGQLRSDSAVFEVDEAAFPAAVQALKPQTVLVLNLFRDQLDRYGELNTLASKLKDALAKTSTEVVLNADDPLVAWLGKGLEKVAYFGLSGAKVERLPHDFAADSNACPVCGRSLNYQQLFYSHIGIYQCSNNDFRRPEPKVVGNTTSASLTESVTEVKFTGSSAKLELQLPGLYNAYNGLAAVTLLGQIGYSLAQSAKIIEAMPPAFGRAEVIEIEGRKLQLFLVKNPTGFNQVIQSYRNEPAKLPLYILVNDLLADGRDVSWLWDVAFEDLPSQSITAGGTRSLDLALRLKYADHHSQPTAGLAGLKDFINTLPEGGSGIILPTYTAMLQLRQELGKSVKLAGTNQ